jgi:hypothetical protein
VKQRFNGMFDFDVKAAFLHKEERRPHLAREEHVKQTQFPCLLANRCVGVSLGLME